MQPALRLRGKTSPFSKTMCEAEGESSGGEEESAASTSTRCSCGQFVWPCPREYPVDVGERKKQKWLIPADLQKEEMGLLFKDMCTKMGLGPAILKIHVFDEPHKRYNMQTKKRQRHKHLVFKMASGFAHLKLKKRFMAHGIYGHFSFNLVGYVAYLRYCLCQSANLRLILTSSLGLGPQFRPRRFWHCAIRLRRRWTPETGCPADAVRSASS